MDKSIKLSDLTKVYKGTTVPAVNNLTLTVKSGEVYGLLGPNGAGKTTTIRMIMSFIAPTSGWVEIFGQKASFENYQVKDLIGYLPSDMEFFQHMNGHQFLSYMGSLQKGNDLKYFDELVKKFQVDLDKKIEELSRGNRQKIAIVQALMHKPNVLILDEPTSGLDPLMQEVFYEEILSAKKRGAVVLLSSHILGEVQKICDKVGIIKQGKLVKESAVEELLKTTGQNFVIEFDGKPPLAELKKIKDLTVPATDKNIVRVSLGGKLSEFLKFLSEQDVVSLRSKEADLEEVFLGYYESEVK